MSIHKQRRNPTLYQLRFQYGLNVYDLSQAGNTSSYTVWCMLIGIAVTRQDAEHVLAGLNTLKGTHYTLADVDVLLKNEEGDKKDENGYER